MKKNGSQFGLYVAVQSINDAPPCILDTDGRPIIPVRVEYSPILNPVWIRLMMRSLRAFGGHCKGAYSLGCPLLKVDSWAEGVNAINLDCRTQQLNDKNTTEIALFYTNVPLRPLSSEDDPECMKKPLWVYDKNKVLVRWYPGDGKRPKGTLFKEVSKSKNFRKQRPFLDLSTPKRFEQSWPMVLKPVQDEFIRFAREYGFELSAKTLNLQPLSLKTKSKTNKSKSTFPSIDVSGEIKIIDLRVNTNIAVEEILSLYGSLIAQKGVSVSWNYLKGVEQEDLTLLQLEQSDRVLVLIDQRKRIEHDRYALTKPLVSRCAMQHINVNPHDVTGDPIKTGLLIEPDNNDKSSNLYLTPESDYYNYSFEHLITSDYKEGIIRKLEVTLKELELKRLLIDSNRGVSQALPAQKKWLNESMLVITDGYLFTVSNDRPVLIPFDPTDSHLTSKANEYLLAFDTSVDGLLTLINENWPYSYRQDVVMNHHGAGTEKQKQFTSKIKLILSNRVSDKLSIMMQDPSYDRPNMLPLGMEDVYSDLTKKQKEHVLLDWVLPDIEVLRSIVKELGEDDVLPGKTVMRFENELPELIELWQEQLAMLSQQNQAKVTYYQIKKAVMQSWLGRRDKEKDTLLSGCLDTVLSRHFDRPLNDIKRWMNNIPGIQRIWYDKEQGYFVIGGLSSIKSKLARQPSIRQWHALKGELDIDLLVGLLDVDWVRMNQLAGNPCVASIITRWKEINSDVIISNC